MYRRSRVASILLSLVLLISALFLLASIIISRLPQLSGLSGFGLASLAGRFLLDSFSLLAFYPVLYLVYNAVLIGLERDTRSGLYITSFLMLPMLTLSVLIRTLFDPTFASTRAGAWLFETFSRSGAISLSAITSLILMLGTYLISSMPKRGSEEDAGLAQKDQPRAEEELVEEVRGSMPPLMLPRMTQFTPHELDGEEQVPQIRAEEGSKVVSEEEVLSAVVATSTEEEEQSRAVALHSNSAATLEVTEAQTRPQLYEEAQTQQERHNIVDAEIVPYEETATDPELDEVNLDDIDLSAAMDDALHGTLDIHELASENPTPPPSPNTATDTSTNANSDTSKTPPTPAYAVPIHNILNIPEREAYWQIDADTTAKSELLQSTLKEFGIQAEVTGIRKGPVITMFEILPASGVKLNRIVNLVDNIALSLAAESVRIIAPVPGKHAVGIEIPNRKRHLVSFSEILLDPKFQASNLALPVALGKDITGEAQVIDLAKTPHILIAGATGAGKSVCVNSVIASLLYSRSPEEVKMILIDPKIVELKLYNGIAHLLTPVITDPKRAFQALKWCLGEMERRYSLLDGQGVRDITQYNTKVTRTPRDNEGRLIAGSPPLPYLVVLIDEFADLIASSGKELESKITRLAAMSRAVGIHLVLATQRPSTDVITGLIKANIPSRIAFMVASKVDSRIIIDSIGAEKLLGRGDMLFSSAWHPFPLRIQGTFLSDSEVENIVRHVKTLGPPQYIDDEIFIESEEEFGEVEDADDPLISSAIEIVQSTKKASASFLQRRLSIGYNRAARLMEVMEDMGIIGPQNGSKPREVLVQH